MAFFGMVSEFTGVTLKAKYLESVLKQDVEWFETNNPEFLNSKINLETSAIQTATGERTASFFFSMGNFGS